MVVVFNGSMNEKLGIKNGEFGYIDGDGAVTAQVTVYGPQGANDIQEYIGFTMSSNYAINGGGPVDCIDNCNPSPPDYHPYSDTQKDQVYVHASNKSGFAGERTAKLVAVSTGCLLLYGKQWPSFCNQIGHRGFHLVLSRN